MDFGQLWRNLFFHLPIAFLAAVFFGFPSRRLKIVGVTGTDGKTTTATLIYKILLAAGKKVGLVSSVSAKLGKQKIDTGFHVTTPDSVPLQRLLRRMADEGFKYVVLEATSHGLDQYRLWGIDFLAGVITNVTHEHLDYHKTYQNYLEAKSKLFQKVKIAVLNRDDKSYEYLNGRRQMANGKSVTYGIKNRADYTPKSFPFKTKLPGEYNQYNCLAAIAVTDSLGIPRVVIRKAVADFPGVEGRMEEIKKGQNFRVVIDFAHTPNALENALKTLRSQMTKNGRLIAVFGCAGLRDKEKRPMMGAIAAKLADIAILTAEDPRTEDVNDIIGQIAQGALVAGGREKSSFFRMPDRRQAICFAVQRLAQKGDVIVICGKGHEKSMCYGKTEYPWSDREEALVAIQSKKRRCAI